MMKKLFLSSFIAFLFLLPVEAKEFSDVGVLHPDYVAIAKLSDDQVLSGYDDGTFRPDLLVNRAEAVKIILKGLGIEPLATVTQTSFSDVAVDDWFAGYIEMAVEKGIVTGNADGLFVPGRTVQRAELAKMLLNGVGFKKELWENEQLFDDVPLGQWFTPYMNYAGKSGIISKDKDNKVYPAREMTRAEVAETVYLLQVMLSGDDTAFLMVQSEKQLAQIGPYLEANDLLSAHRAAALAVNMTQQAIKVDFEDQLILAKAKIAKAYQMLVDAFIAMVENNKSEALDLSKQAIDKAGEAKQVSGEVAATADYLVDKAKEVMAQASM